MISPDAIRVICSDIDGTLLPFGGKDLQPTADVLEALVQRGYVFVLCTGRGTGNIPPVLAHVPGVRYAITGNGARVVDLSDGTVLRSAVFSPELAWQYYRYIREHFEIAMFCYIDGIHYLDTAVPVDISGTTGSMRDWYNSAKRADFDELLSHGRRVDKIGLLSMDAALKARIRADIALQPFADQLFVSNSGDWNIETNVAAGNKGAAARWLCEHLGFNAEQELLVAGDNGNDLTMFDVAALSVAPENAAPEVLARADIRVPDCAADGVEHFFESLPGII